MDISLQKNLLLPEIKSLLEDDGFHLEKGYEYNFTKRTQFGGIKLSLFFSEIGESSNSLFSLSHQEVEEIMLNVGVPYNSWVKEKKGKKLLYTFYDGITRYPFTRRNLPIGDTANNEIEYIESEEDVLRWKEALISYINRDGKLFIEEFSYLPNVLRRLNQNSTLETLSYTKILLGRLDHLFRALIISKLCDDPFFQEKLSLVKAEIAKDENFQWINHFNELETRLSALQARYSFKEI